MIRKFQVDAFISYPRSPANFKRRRADARKERFGAQAQAYRKSTNTAESLSRDN
jgi:hypothetical protein